MEGIVRLEYKVIYSSRFRCVCIGVCVCVCKYLCWWVVLLIVDIGKMGKF